MCLGHPHISLKFMASKDLPSWSDFLQDGDPRCDVDNVTLWEHVVAPCVQRKFEECIYGHIPTKDEYTCKIVESQCIDEEWKCGGETTAKLFEVYLQIIVLDSGNVIHQHLLVAVPSHEAKVPVLIGPNFFGNHTVSSHPQISLPCKKVWLPSERKENTLSSEDKQKYELFRASPEEFIGARGTASHRWELEFWLRNGVAVITFYHGDMCPDNADLALRRTEWPIESLPRCVHGTHHVSPFDPDKTGALSAWALGFHTAIDFVCSVDAACLNLDTGKIVAFGHSRNGKAALWAAATDKRISAVISNCSGCAGAAMAREKQGESIEAISRRFPHWFVPKYSTFVNREVALPIDQHLLIGLIAPRPVLIHSAMDDAWADPVSEYRSVLAAANQVYALYNLANLPYGEDYSKRSWVRLPQEGIIVGSVLCFQIRPGRHSIGLEDFQVFREFLQGNLFTRDECR